MLLWGGLTSHGPEPGEKASEGWQFCLLTSEEEGGYKG